MPGSESESLVPNVLVADDSRIKETLRKAFASAAEDFMARLQRIEQFIGALRGALPVSAF